MSATVLRFETLPQREARLYAEVMAAFDRCAVERSRTGIEALVRAMRAFAAPRPRPCLAPLLRVGEGDHGRGAGRP